MLNRFTLTCPTLSIVCTLLILPVITGCGSSSESETMLIQLPASRTSSDSTLTNAIAPISEDQLALADTEVVDTEAKGTDKKSSDKDQESGKEESAKNGDDKKQAESDTNAFEAKHPFPRRMEAPEFEKGEWLNTSGPLTLKDLRGKYVVLDFWTYCCINCMHILPELKKLEHAYPNNVVVIGVHSAKFDTEKDTDNIREAILRYDIEHPVINDSEMKVWRSYGCSSWPSLRVIDPEGQLVAGHSGEIEFKTLDGFVKSTLPYYRAKKALNEKPLQFNIEKFRHRKESPLFFPGKVLTDEANDRLFISDSNHDRIVVTALDGTLKQIIGTGEKGLKDGNFETAQFHDPQGLALRKDTLYVADNENHAIRKVDLAKKTVETISGDGTQRRTPWPGIDIVQQKLPERFVDTPKGMSLNSPWALWIHQEDLYIAMAGPHQIWKMTLDEKEMGPYAGNGREDIVDGPLLPEAPYQQGYSSFAQPSGFASDGTWLYVADSEGSSIRAVPFDPTKEVKTIIGTNHLPGGRLFEFGDVDGKYPDAKLQHCLGVTYDGKGNLYLADTYNNKIKVLNIKERSVKTLVGDGKSGTSDEPPQFDEPAGIAIAKGKLYVADTNNHAIRVIDLKDNKVSTLKIPGLKPPVIPEKLEPGVAAIASTEVKVQATPVKVSDNQINLKVSLQLPESFKLNPLAPMRYYLSCEEGEKLVDTQKLSQSTRVKPPATSFEIPIPTTAATGEGAVKIKLNYFYCSEGSEGVCKVGSVTWLVPLQATADASESSVPLNHEIR